MGGAGVQGVRAECTGCVASREVATAGEHHRQHEGDRTCCLSPGDSISITSTGLAASLPLALRLLDAVSLEATTEAFEGKGAKNLVILLAIASAERADAGRGAGYRTVDGKPTAG